ncbi:hypothetical protein BT96DRAFT_746447, partial [Gymnopus androsaceus JB14]
DNKSKAGDGGNFPMAVYNAAAAECNKILTQGALKTGLSCKNKFSKYLRPTFNICYIIHKYSGIGGFDTLTGAHITPETELLWEDIVKSNPKCEPYKYKGWSFWDKMLEIMARR